MNDMQEIIYLLNEMSPYLLLGFLLAGMMHAFMPKSYYGRFLGDRSFRSVVNAALFGIPLPLCSCGVIPTAMSLRKEGASKGATVSFLIATPQTGVDSIIATYSLMGLPFAIARPIAALLTSVFGGGLVNITERNEPGQCCGESCSREAEEKKTFCARCIDALEYAFVEMMGDIGKWLAIGLLVAGLITVLVPESWFSIFQGNTFASMLLVLAIAMPMYVCATGSIPIAVALMLKGLTPGAALVLLMAGPACNLASMLVVHKVLGTRTTLVYILSIVIGAICFGTLIDWLQFSGAVDFLARLNTSHRGCCDGDSVFSIVCSVVLALLLINALFIHGHIHKHDNTNNTMNAKIYHIEGMNCNHCRMSAEKALRSVEGVTAASVDLATGEALVEGTATREALAEALDGIGFTLKD